MCPEHGTLCAYTGAEADRCPWCHCLWVHLVAAVRRDPDHGHSCESLYTMRNHRERVAEAAGMRRVASINLLSGPNRVRG